MPHTTSNLPFLSLHNGSHHQRSDAPQVNASEADAPFASLSPRISGSPNGYINGAASNNTTRSSAGDDEFLRLSKPQQDVLLLHGPGKRYSLERQNDLPALQNDREILVQVLAIGLNPVDWKGPDYGM